MAIADPPAGTLFAASPVVVVGGAAPPLWQYFLRQAKSVVGGYRASSP
jgi:hypothetical protein